MGQRQLHKLSFRTITAKRHPGLYADGGGLYLQVADGGTRTWIFRFTSPITRKPRWMGLGALHAVGLPVARKSAETQRGLLSQGIDPIEARKEEIARKTVEDSKAVTFKQCATAYVDAHRASWKNSKHTEQWTYTLERYAGPVIGSLPVQEVETGLVLKVLEPIWTTKPETASRLRGR